MSYTSSYQDISSNKMVDEIPSNKSFIYENYDISANSSVNIPIRRNDDSSSQKFLIVDSDEFPENYMPSILKYAPTISFDKEIKEEMFQNISFQKFISEIEYMLFHFTEKYQISLKAKIYYQKDWEIEDVRNIILLLKLYNMTFEGELKLWEDLSHFVRRGLRTSGFYLKSKGILRDFEEYSKLFYIKLDLV